MYRRCQMMSREKKIINSYFNNEKIICILHILPGNLDHIKKSRCHVTLPMLCLNLQNDRPKLVVDRLTKTYLLNRRNTRSKEQVLCLINIEFVINTSKLLHQTHLTNSTLLFSRRFIQVGLTLFSFVCFRRRQVVTKHQDFPHRVNQYQVISQGGWNP